MRTVSEEKGRGLLLSGWERLEVKAIVQRGSNLYFSSKKLIKPILEYVGHHKVSLETMSPSK